MKEKHIEFVNKHTFKPSEFNKVNFNMECLLFDTESCQKIEGDNTGAKVYGWGLGCIRTDNTIIGQDLNQFWQCMKDLFELHCNLNKNLLKVSKVTVKESDEEKKERQKKGLSKGVKKEYPSVKYIKIPVGVHNLGWDIEFLKYSLIENGYSYSMGEVEKVASVGQFYYTAQVNQKEKIFHIVQNNNVVYGCTVYTPFSFFHINKDGSQTKIGLCIDFFDTYKIISAPEKNFGSFLHSYDRIFDKLEEQYDYETFREEGHIQTELEKRYQYNDIYMLKKVMEEFYIDGLMGGKMPQSGSRTASSIAFNVLKKMTFGDKKTEELYTQYFEIDVKTAFEDDRKAIEKHSYSGGYTHANSRFLHQKLNGMFCSLDINSSYPSQMMRHLFPYGKPVKSEFGIIPEIDKENQVYIVQVGFDFVRPKCKEYDLPIFKIGASNSKKLKPICGNISGQEYFSTNITEEGKIIIVEKEIDNCILETNYNVCLTNVEFDFWVKHFDFGCFVQNELGFDEDVEDIEENEFNGLDIGEVLIYKAEKGKFKGFVEYFAKMKIDASKSNNNALKNQSKLFLNSCYGKFGTKQEKREQMLIMDKHGIMGFTSIDSIEYEGKEFYRPYASYVTAYGRLQLWNAIIYAVGVENFLYCDTDSIYCKREKNSLIKDMEKIGEEIHPTNLGGWDVEHIMTEFKVLGQKKYMYKAYTYDKKTKEINGDEIIVKCCGLPKEARELIANEGFDSFHIGKEVEGKLQRKKVIGGALLLPCVFTIKRIMW